MRYSVWNPSMLDGFERAGLSNQQRTLIEYTLRALEPGTFLSEHVASAKSAALALARAHHALESHALSNQPRIGLTRTVLARALAEVNSAVSAFSVTAVGRSAISHAMQAVTRAVTELASPQMSPMDKANRVADISAASMSLPPAIHSIAEEFWNGAQVAPDAASRIKAEVAVLVALAGRDGRALQVDLIREIKRGANDFESIRKILWPPLQQYRVKTVIYGVRRLDDLEGLMPGARQRPLDGLEAHSGALSSDIQNILDRAQETPGNRMVLSASVEASDAYTAVARVRRNIAETLDQYAAGQRLLDLDIGAESVAVAAGGRPITSQGLGGAAKLARPLTVHWAAPVRPALRMASLAGKIDAPVASTMLAWSALESLGVDASTGLERVAKACALHSVRQQHISCFKSVTAAASAQVEAARERVYWTGKWLGQTERALRRVAISRSPRARDAIHSIEERLSQLRSEHATSISVAAAVEQQVASAIGVIQRDLLGGADPTQPLQASSYSLDVNVFLDAMLPPTSGSLSDLAQASREALATLAAAAGGLARDQFLSWQARLADPVALAEWIDLHQSGYHGLLAWMYASRNLAIHTGGFAVPADELTAKAGRGIVDMVLEFLGYWYKTFNEQGLPDEVAIDIIKDLAERKDRLTSQLRVAVTCYPLDIAKITAPNSDCWNRRQP